MATKQKGFLLYLDNYELIEDLSDKEKGQWIDAVFLYKRDGVITEFPKGTLLKTAFKVAKSQLDRDSEAWNETCQKRAESGRKGGLARASNTKQKQARASNTKQNLTNLADNDKDNENVNVNVIDTDIDIVIGTNTEQVDADLDAVAPSSSFVADANETKAHDLFSLEKLQTIVANNKIKITTEGLEAFFEEMQDSGWMLYSEPIEKRFIARAIRGWLQHNEQYLREESEKKSSSIRIATIKKAVEYVPQTLIHECSERGESWIKYIPEHCPKDIFTDEELTLLEERYDISLEDW